MCLNDEADDDASTRSCRNRELRAERATKDGIRPRKQGRSVELPRAMPASGRGGGKIGLDDLGAFCARSARVAPIKLAASGGGGSNTRDQRCRPSLAKPRLEAKADQQRAAATGANNCTSASSSSSSLLLLLEGSRLFSLSDLTLQVVRSDNEHSGDDNDDTTTAGPTVVADHWRATMGDDEHDHHDELTRWASGCLSGGRVSGQADNELTMMAPSNQTIRIRVVAPHRRGGESVDASATTTTSRARLLSEFRRVGRDEEEVGNQARNSLVKSEAESPPASERTFSSAAMGFSEDNNSRMVVTQQDERILPEGHSKCLPRQRWLSTKSQSSDDSTPRSRLWASSERHAIPSLIASVPRRRPSAASHPISHHYSPPVSRTQRLFLALMMPTLALTCLALFALTSGALEALKASDREIGSNMLDQQQVADSHFSMSMADLLEPISGGRLTSSLSLSSPSSPSPSPSPLPSMMAYQHNDESFAQPPTPAGPARYHYTDQIARPMTLPNELSPVMAEAPPSAGGGRHDNQPSDLGALNSRPPPSVSVAAHEGALSSMGSAKFSRANELDAFLDDMNHKELQTVAAGRPIADLFQPKPFDMTPVASHGNQQKPRATGDAGHAAETDARRSTDLSPKASGGSGGGGLMGSHSEQQIYSDCALILQRTYVKNMEDSKHHLVPFGKTEQACISYKHIDKAIEQAKHKLRFKEFVKMRNQPPPPSPPAPPVGGGGSSPAPPPPPPLDVLQTSLEPPEDLVAAIGEINMAATQIIADQFDLSNDELLNGLPLIDMSKTKFASICPLLVRQDLKCELTRFRTFTAHCNNLKHPTWGAAKTPYARYLPPVHPDGIWVPRKSIVSEITFDLGVGHRETHTDFSPSMPLPAIHKEMETHGRQYFPPAPGSTTSLLGEPAEGSGRHASAAAAANNQESPVGSPQHRLGLLRPGSNALDGEPNISELEHQADAELMREVHDDGTHMDMASSVAFARHAHPDEAAFPERVHFPESGSMAAAQAAGGLHGQAVPTALMHHHHKMVGINEAAAAQAHLQHMAPLVAPHKLAASLPAPVIHRPRKSRAMPQELPSARLVSSIVHRDADIPNHEFTVLFLSWGQLLDHDMTRAAQPPQTIKCCPSANGAAASKHKLCLPIEVPPNDPFYGKFGVQCLEFRRTLAGVRPNCVLGPRVHQNANTAPIDANFVYGSSQATADSLRLFKGGRLRDRDWFRQEGLKPLLPAQEIDPDLSCLGRPRDLFCFLAGDIRVNEQTHLTVLHTLYMREHNRLADKLSELNPHWDDERTFQEARHIVAAGVQHALINEYIPLLIGRKMAQLYNLTSMVGNHHHHHHHHHHQQGAYWHGYDPTVTTSVANSFAAAAFRQGHTFVQSTIDRFNKYHEFVTNEKLRHLFMQPFLLYQPGVLDELVGGLINRQSQSYDPFMTEELAGHLFQPPEQEFGHDLASINLQRGRDQGLPGYNLFREWCGLPRAETFEQLEPYLTNRTAYLYSKLYKHVDDIDLWSAGISERKLPGAAIGPTFSCIISRQFSNTRRGDRFWYENPGLPSSFTPDQLAEIRKFTMAKFLCTNSDDMPTIQRWAFRLAHPVLNPRVDCSQLPEMDLQYWQEE